MTGPRAAAVLLCGLTAAASGCSSARAPPCPGEPVATLHFQGARDAGDTCPSIGGASVAFTATIAWDGAAGALLCPDRPEAQPLRGTRDGQHIVVASPAVPANAPQCTCALQVTETLEGDLAQVDGDVAFGGELRNAFEPSTAADPAACNGAGGTTPAPSCGVPCVVHWQLTATP